MRSRRILLALLIIILAVSASLCIQGFERSPLSKSMVVELPGVSSDGEGTMLEVRITMTPGDGETIIESNVILGVDFQGAIAVARMVAEEYYDYLRDYDVKYEIYADTSSITGPSAGLGIALATLALARGWSFPDDLTATGAIFPDGMIGEVGGIGPKIEAARRSGKERILIPDQPYNESLEGEIEVIRASSLDDALLKVFGARARLFLRKEREVVVDNSFLRSMARESLERSRELLDEAEDRVKNLNRTNETIQIFRTLNTSRQLLGNAERMFEMGLYYSAMSQSFGSAVSSRSVIYMIEASNESLRRILKDVKELIEDVEDDCDSRKPENSIQIEALGAAKYRVDLAKRILEGVERALEEGNLTVNKTMVLASELAMAYERTLTATHYLRIFDMARGEGRVSLSDLADLATRYLDDAERIKAYATSIFGPYSEAERDLRIAERALERGDYSEALIASVLAMSEYTAFMEAHHRNSSSLRDLAESKRNSYLMRKFFWDAMEDGAYPLMSSLYFEYSSAITMEEFSETFGNPQSMFRAVVYAEIARNYARLSRDLLEFCSPGRI